MADTIHAGTCPGSPGAGLDASVIPRVARRQRCAVIVTREPFNRGVVVAMKALVVHKLVVQGGQGAMRPLCPVRGVLHQLGQADQVRAHGEDDGIRPGSRTADTIETSYSERMNEHEASPPILEMRHLSKWYGKGTERFRALDDVSVSVWQGESLAIVGKSGSGKSTMMHILALLDTADAGSVLIDGKDATTLTRSEVDKLRNQRFGFVFQQFFLTPGNSVLDNVILPLKIAGVPRDERRRRGMAALERFDLADKARNRATDLSGGQKQRVVLTRALVGEPDVIFADEPTGNLDTVTGAIVEDELFALNRDHGITLVIVTHDEDLAERCDRRIHVRDGRLVESLEVSS